jgi:hypothetical protein
MYAVFPCRRSSPRKPPYTLSHHTQPPTPHPPQPLHACLQADRQLEEQEKRAAEAKAAAEAAAKQKEAEDAARRERKRAALGAEPTAADGEVCRIAVRLPQGGKAQRSFLATDALERVFDWVDVEGLLDPEETRLVQTRPARRAYAYPDDRALTLAEAGLSGQVLLLAEPAR